MNAIEARQNGQRSVQRGLRVARQDEQDDGEHREEDDFGPSGRQDQRSHGQDGNR